MNNTNHNYVSIDYVANRILKHPLLKDTNPEDINDLIIGVLRMGNLQGLNIDKQCTLIIDEHKVVIPKDALRIKSLSYVVGKNLNPMLYNSTSSRLNSKHNGNTNSYTINDGIIITSVSKGKVSMIYEAFRLNEEGIPMIPSSETLFRMLDAHVKTHIFGVLFDLGKLNERSLLRAEQEYYFYAAKLEAEFKGFKNEDHMESVINQTVRLFPVNDSESKYNSSILKVNNQIL